jgi:hypothetical protein
VSLQDLVTIRELQTSDIKFLLASSLQSIIQYLDSTYKGYNKATLYKEVETKVLFALNKLGYSVFMAVHSQDSEHILGYIVAHTEKNHVLLQYTKYAYRKLGIQKNLLLPLVIDGEQPITVQWNTKEMVKLHKASKLEVKDVLTEQLIQMIEGTNENN